MLGAGAGLVRAVDQGLVFARDRPGLAAWNDWRLERYQGPLALAKDLMVFNVTREAIRTRMTVTADSVWPNKEHHEEFRSAVREERMQMSRWLADRQIFPKF